MIHDSGFMILDAVNCSKQLEFLLNDLGHGLFGLGEELIGRGFFGVRGEVFSEPGDEGHPDVSIDVDIGDAR